MQKNEAAWWVEKRASFSRGRLLTSINQLSFNQLARLENGPLLATFSSQRSVKQVTGILTGVGVGFLTKQGTQPPSGPVQGGPQSPAAGTLGVAVVIEVRLQAAPDISPALRLKLPMHARERPVDHVPGPAAIQFEIGSGPPVSDVDFGSVFITQRKTDHAASPPLASAVLPALDQMRSHARKEKRRLLPVVGDGRCPFMLALGHQLGEKLLHGVFRIVALAASGTGKGAERGPVAAIKIGRGVGGGG